MARDFAAAFGVGEDDKSIDMADANGVAMAAIRALHQMLREKAEQIRTLQAEVGSLKDRAIESEART